MDKRFKILISAYACEPGKGSEPDVGWQWALQMARFHDVTVLTRTNNRAGIESELARMDDRPKPQFIYVDLDPLLLRMKTKFRATRIYYILWQRAARKLIKHRLRHEHYDLLHHITFATFRFPAAIWGHGIKCIWGPVGGIESIPTSLLPWRYPKPLLLELVRNFDNLIHTTVGRNLKKRARKSNLVLVSTNRMLEVCTNLGVPTQRMPTIGMHTHSFPIPPRLVHHKPLRLLYVGNLITLKGLDLALSALQESGIDGSLTLVGDGPFRSDLDKLVIAAGLKEKVQFVGRIPRDQVFAIYKDHDVLLFPSLHDSGGYVVIEAMCSAMPVICLDTGGPSTAVQANCGICVPLRSRKQVITDLANAIVAYDRDRERIVHDGMAARTSVETHYDWGRKGQLMNQYYSQVVLAERAVNTTVNNLVVLAPAEAQEL